MKEGFSFISLLITLVIIGLLCMVCLPQFKQTVKTQHTTQMHVLQQARQLQQQLNIQQQSEQRMLEGLEGGWARPRSR